MEKKKHSYGSISIFLLILIAGIFSASSCINAEIKKSKREDVKLDDRFCYLPRSAAFGFGIAALAALSAAEVIGNLTIIWWRFCTEKKSSGAGGGGRIPVPAVALLVISWISFALATIAVSAATSMNERQPYGKGWLDGECYLVRDGVYIGSAVSVIVTTACLQGSLYIVLKRNQVDQGLKVHAQQHS